MTRSTCWSLLVLSACTGTSSISTESPEAIRARLNERSVDVSMGDGAATYLGFEVSPSQPSPGDRMTLTHYWLANGPLPGQPYRVFVHTLLDGARGWIPHGDHDPPVDTTRWPAGKVVVDRQTMDIPPSSPGGTVRFLVGLYRGKERLPVDTPEAHDGTHRVFAGTVDLRGTPIPRPSYRAPRFAKPPTLDGVVDPGEWDGSPWIDGFVRSRGDGPPRQRTRARMGWDANHLYVLMVAEDPDIQGTLKPRDAPIYRQESLELFIDADDDQDDYVELQVSPLGTQFDASFQGGPRRGMNRRYDARYQAAVKVEGTVEDASDSDKRWTVEWAVDVSSIPDATVPLRGGTTWRLNLLRVGKDRAGGRQIPDESAWSPPMMGDFHNLERLGELWFVETAQEAQ